VYQRGDSLVCCVRAGLCCQKDSLWLLSVAGFGIDWSVCDRGKSPGLLLDMCRQAQALGSCSEGVAAVVEPVENSSYLCL